MDIVQIASKGNFMNILQTFYIYIYIYMYIEPHLNNQLNNKSTLSHKTIFESIMQQKHAR
jgi:hypothetical protein